MRRIVTLFGTILPEDQRQSRGNIVLDVDPDLGDAKEFGLAGQITLLPRQCFSPIYEAKSKGERSHIRIPEHIAQALSENTVAHKKKRRR
jgi:hypothetical protein